MADRVTEEMIAASRAAFWKMARGTHQIGTYDDCIDAALEAALAVMPDRLEEVKREIYLLATLVENPDAGWPSGYRAGGLAALEILESRTGKATEKQDG